MKLKPARLESLSDRYIVNINGRRLFRTKGKTDQDLQDAEEMIKEINNAERLPTDWTALAKVKEGKMSEKPKPTTGEQEWPNAPVMTEVQQQIIKELAAKIVYHANTSVRVIAVAINAALAERRKRENTERGAVIFAEANAKTIQQLREQLAGHIKAANEVTDENIELERQLATAVEALKVIEIGHGVDARTARAVLAKIGDK